MGKSKKTPKGNKVYEQGYVSFTPEDLARQAQNDVANSDAYELLDKAMFTSSHVSVKDKERGEVDIDDIYPITCEEADEMDRLLERSEAAAGNPRDRFFQDRLGELRGIVRWSKQRHWNFSWMVIVGVIVSVFVLSQCSKQKDIEAKDVERNLATVENWAENDTTIAIESLKSKMNDIPLYAVRFSSPNVYKMEILASAARNYYGSLNAADENRAKADTASTSGSKENYLKWAKEKDENAKEYLAKYNEINALSFKEVKEMAMEAAKDKVSEAKSSARWVWFWNIFFLILIPVYIFAERPYGYTISRYRAEAKVLGGIKKGGLALAGGLLGIAGSIGFVNVVTKWSDGTTTREDDGTGPVRLGLKLFLVVAAVVVICAVSCFLMLYSTIMGLKRNYDWKTITAGIKK